MLALAQEHTAKEIMDTIENDIDTGELTRTDEFKVIKARYAIFLGEDEKVNLIRAYKRNRGNLTHLLTALVPEMARRYI